MIFIDFDEQKFRSSFYDQSLENRMPKGWIGVFGEVIELIAYDYHYWNVGNKALI
jgi:hypothetical protein